MTPAINTTMTPLEWALLVALSVLWGCSFFFVGVVVEALPPFTIVVLRVGIAALILWPVAAIWGARGLRDRRAWPAFVAMGLLNNVVPFSLSVWGQSHIASGLASILNAATPLLTVVVAHWLTRDERMTPARLTGVVLGLAGVVAMIGPGAFDGFGAAVLAQLAVVAATVCYAFAGVYGRRFRRIGTSSLATATGQVTASAVLLAPVALVVERPWEIAMPGPEIWAAIVGVAALSTALGYVLYFRILATAGATNLLLVTLLIPVTGILLGVTVLGERLASEHALGMGLIALGLAAIDGRLARRLPAIVSPARRGR